jgi:hypothetical protein
MFLRRASEVLVSQFGSTFVCVDTDPPIDA